MEKNAAEQSLLPSILLKKLRLEINLLIRLIVNTVHTVHKEAITIYTKKKLQILQKPSTTWSDAKGHVPGPRPKGHRVCTYSFVI